MEYVFWGSMIELAFFGLLFGIGLALAAKKFAVEVDPRVEKVLEILPNANCGACGYPGCSGFAKAVVAGEVPVTGCPVGGQSVAEKIASILGVEVGEVEPMVAVAACNGGIRAKDKYEYDGIEDCRAAMVMGGGPKLCSYGCIGLGTCVEACPFDALSMGPLGVPVTDFDKCTGCGICVDVCPTGVMKLVPKSQPVFVACNSKDPGVFVRKACETGCISCFLCQKNCPKQAIKVVNNLAEIDYDKCDACGICIMVCPTKVILNKFPDVMKANKGLPAAVPTNPDETKALLDEIKKKQAEAKKAPKKPSEKKGDN